MIKEKDKTKPKASKESCSVYSKGIASTFSFVLTIVIVIAAITIVLVTSRSAVQSSTSFVEVSKVEDILQLIDNGMREVMAEGFNATRVVSFTTSERFESIPSEDSIEFKKEGTNVFGVEYLTRSMKNNILFIGGDDVQCSETDGNNDGIADLVVENSFLKAVFQRVAKNVNLSNISTSSNLIRLVEKTGNTTITFANSSITIDSNVSTSSGRGYSELQRNGTLLPACTAHFFVNATSLSYDVYYKLYAGADFLVMDVRNIR